MNGIEKKISDIKNFFSTCSTPEDRYKKIIELGKTLTTYPATLKTPTHQVPGCQSILFLLSRLENGLLFFDAHSDALISSGLAALLIAVYSGESPETILNTPPLFLQELGILGSLTPSRSNGLANIHLRMKKEAVHSFSLAKN